MKARSPAPPAPKVLILPPRFHKLPQPEQRHLRRQQGRLEEGIRSGKRLQEEEKRPSGGEASLELQPQKRRQNDYDFGQRQAGLPQEGRSLQPAHTNHPDQQPPQVIHLFIAHITTRTCESSN